jgi:hypothetical protein
MKEKNKLITRANQIQKLLVLSILICLFTSSAFGQSEVDTLLKKASTEAGTFSFRRAENYLKEVQKIDSMNAKLIYLHSEMKLFLGDDDFSKYFEKLREIGADEYYQVMKLKHAIFIGLTEHENLLEELLVKYPDNGEIKFVQWLSELDKRNYEKCIANAHEISNGTIFKFAPYLALFNVSWDKDYSNAILYMDTVEHILGREFYGSKYRDILKVLADTEILNHNKGVTELPFAWCGSGVGFYMIDDKGDSLKIELDTGTFYNMMTVHDKSQGEKISGNDVLVVKDGISYNYMEKPADLHYKKSKFTIPAYENFIFGYFDSQFFSADGCTSPFVFKDRALHMNPIDEKVFLFDHENLEKYIKENEDKLEKVPYIVRNGWVFIPCKINGTEVLMQIETGSRDVNFSTLALDALGLESYASSLEWRGQEFPIDKVDCILEIGKIKYDVNGGLVTDKVFTNLYYGLATAGDIGPVFMNNFVFTIDIFNQQIIFEIN